MLINCLAVGAGGALGAIFRYLITLSPIEIKGFLLTTIGINIIGSFCIGLIAELAGKITNFNPYLLLFLKVGLCGGFTTFSAFSIEAIGLLQNGRILTAVNYMVFSVILCIAAAGGAQMLVK